MHLIPSAIALNFYFWEFENTQMLEIISRLELLKLHSRGHGLLVSQSRGPGLQKG